MTLNLLVVMAEITDLVLDPHKQGFGFRHADTLERMVEGGSHYSPSRLWHSGHRSRRVSSKQATERLELS